MKIWAMKNCRPGLIALSGDHWRVQTSVTGHPGSTIRPLCAPLVISAIQSAISAKIFTLS
jgi:hypothetical protein